MKWEEIRQQYPYQWLLIEAKAARTNSGHRILDQMSVIGTFSDSVAAMQSYAQLHHAPSDRELYVCHTAQDQPEVTERNGVGLHDL